MKRSFQAESNREKKEDKDDAPVTEDQIENWKQDAVMK